MGLLSGPVAYDQVVATQFRNLWKSDGVRGHRDGES